MAKSDQDLAVPPEWNQLDPADLSGTVVVIGGTDTGKSTLVRWLVEEQRRAGRFAGWLDADPGQSTLGLPATLNLALVEEPFGRPKVVARWFVGSNSPRGHMLPVLTGLHRLRDLAVRRGCETLVIDTSGMVDPESGGGALKQWKLELLQPRTVIGLRREEELDHLLKPLRLERRLRLHELSVAEAVRRRTPGDRSARRRERFRAYFEGAQPLRFELGKFPVYNLDQASPGRLIGFLDSEGLTLALGLVKVFRKGVIEALSPAPGLPGVAAVRIGSLVIDPCSGEEC